MEREANYAAVGAFVLDDERVVARTLLEALIDSNKQRAHRTREELANDPGLRAVHGLIAGINAQILRHDVIAHLSGIDEVSRPFHGIGRAP